MMKSPKFSGKITFVLLLLVLNFMPALCDTGPYSVSTSSYDASIRYPTQTLSFYASGRYWILFVNTQLYHTSSADGSTWTTKTALGAVTASGMAAGYFDGTYVHYARVESQVLYYRRGVPNADGTITWSAAEQTVYNNSPTGGILHTVINVLSGGYPAIAYLRQDATNYRPRVKISDNNDGTWSGSEAETTLSNTGALNWAMTLNTLGTGLYVTYARDNNVMLGKAYSGGSWQGEESTGYDVRIGVTCTAIVKDGEVHVAFIEDTDRDIYHGYRTAAGVWQTKTAIQVGTYTNYATGISASSSALYVFWPSAVDSAIYYRRSTDNGATWTNAVGDNAAQKAFDSPATITYTYDLQVYDTVTDSHIGVMWLTGTVAPYTIYFGDVIDNHSPESTSAQFINLDDNHYIYAGSDKSYTLSLTAYDEDGTSDISTITFILTLVSGTIEGAYSGTGCDLTTGSDYAEITSYRTSTLSNYLTVEVDLKFFSNTPITPFLNANVTATDAASASDTGTFSSIADLSLFSEDGEDGAMGGGENVLLDLEGNLVDSFTGEVIESPSKPTVFTQEYLISARNPLNIAETINLIPIPWRWTQAQKMFMVVLLAALSLTAAGAILQKVANNARAGKERERNRGVVKLRW